MTQGGARVRSGPAPDPNALRRERDNSTWTTLPARRDGPTPIWPLTSPTKRELALWERQWTRPQAVMWERMQQEEEVAAYVRQLVRGEDKKATAADRALVLRMQENLGLSQPGLARNRWRIEAEPQGPAQRPAATGPSVRDRFRIVEKTA